MWWVLLITQTALNFAAGWGAFEMDADQDGLADGWRFLPGKTLVSSGVHVERFLDSRVVYRGGASQSFQVARKSAGLSTEFFVLSPGIYPLSPAYPQPGDTLNVRFWIQDSGRVGMTYAAYLILRRSGGDTALTLYESPHFPQTGWQKVEKKILLPQGFRALQIALHVRTGDGPVAGQLWLDHLVLTAGKNLPPPVLRPFRLVRFMPSSFTTDWIRDLVTFDLFVVQDPLMAARIKTINPSLPVYLYATPWVSVVSRKEGPNNVLGRFGDFFPFDWANQKRPECFLTSSTGQRMVRVEGDLEYYAMNVLDPVCRDRVVINLSRYIEDAFRRNTSWTLDGIMADHLGWYATEMPEGGKAIREILRELQDNRNIKVIGSFNANLIAQPGMEDLVRRFHLPMLKHFVHQDGVVPAPRTLEKALKLATEPAILQIQWPKREHLVRYVVDALYLVAHPDLYVTFSSFDERPTEYDLLNRLQREYGEPRGTFKVYKREKDEGSLLFREFSRGILLFNTSGVHTFPYRLKTSMIHPEQGRLEAKSEVNVPPHTSLFLKFAE